MNKRPTLFYIPGMISLLLLPVLLFIYQPTIREQKVLKLIIPIENSESFYGYRFTRLTVMTELKGKKINTIYYDEDHDLNARKLEFIAQEALKLKFYHDTTQVIKVHLSADNTYGEFVQLVNIMYRDKHNRYVLLDNDFYILGECPPKPDEEENIISLWECGTGEIRIEVKTWQQQLREEIHKYKTIIVNNALLLSAFLILIVLPAILKRKRGY